MKLSAIIGCIAAGNIILTFLYQVFILAAFGPDRSTDALYAGMAIPQLFLSVVSGTLLYILVPILTVKDDASMTKEAWSFMLGIFILFSALALLLYIFAPLWVPWTVPGFDTAAHQLTVRLARIQLAGMAFTAASAVLTSVYHARHQFVWAESSSVIASAFGLLFLIFGVARWGIDAAAWAFVVRALIQAILLMPGMGRFASPEWRSESIKEAWRRLFPLLLGTTYYRTDQLLDRLLSSMAPAGQLTLLHFAHQIYVAANTVVGKAIASPILPVLSKLALNQKWLSFKQLSGRRIIWMFWSTVAVFLCILLADNTVYMPFLNYGKLGVAEIAFLRWLLICLGGVWVGGVLGQILSTAFYAHGDTKTPTKIGAAGYSIGIALKIAGFYCFGVLGIALGTTIYYILNAIWLKIILDRNISLHLQDRLRHAG